MQIFLPYTVLALFRYPDPDLSNPGRKNDYSRACRLPRYADDKSCFQLLFVVGL